MIWRFEISTIYLTEQKSPNETTSPLCFDAKKLHVSSQIGRIHATAVNITGIHQLRESSRFGWFHATDGYNFGVDKAGFHATGPI